MAISVVQTVTASSASVTISATSAGNCLVVCVMSDNTSGAASVSGVTLGGSAGNFSQLAAVDEQVSGLPSHWFDTIIWADPNCAGGQTAVAISGTNLNVASTAGGVVVYEISGLAGTGILDQSSTGPGNSGTWSSGTTGTTTLASEIFIGAAVTKGSVAGPGSPWTNAAPAGGFAIAGFQVVSSTGTATYNGTATSGGWAAAVVTLKSPQPVTSTGSLALGPLHMSGNAAVPVTSTGSLALAPLAMSGTAAEVVPQVVNQWAATFAQPASTGWTPPALQSTSIALNNTTSVGGGTGVPTAGNWLFTIVTWTQNPVLADVRTGVADDIRSWWRPGPWSPGTWQFGASGVPSSGSYFIATTGQAAAISAGDHFIDQYNPGVTFSVTSVGAPAFGFQNISFTPPAGNAVNSPDQVTQVGKTRTYVAYTPNLARIPQQVYVNPTGPVAGMAVLVIEVSGFGPWDTVTGTAGNYAASATTLSLALGAPSVPSFILAAAAGDSTAAGQALSPGGSWTALHTVSASDGSDHLCDSVLTAAALGITTGSVSVNATATSAENLSGVIIAVAVNGASPVPAGQNPNWPYTLCEIAPGSGFQTPPELITWADASTRLWSWDEQTGIQYQLGELQSTNLDLEMDNADNALSPQNTQSPFYGTPQILNANSSFEQGTVHWTASGGAAIAQSGTVAYAGNVSLQITPDGVTATPGCGSELISVTAGAAYTVSAWAYCTLGWATGIQAAISWYNSAQVFQSTTSGSLVAIPAAAWTQFALANTAAPAGAAYAKIILQAGGTPSSATLFYLDQAAIVAGANPVRVTPLTSGTPVRIRAAAGTIGGTTVNRWYVIARNVLEWPEEIDTALRRFVTVTGTDIWSIISASPPTPYRGEVAADGPYAWWPCDDQPGTGGVLPKQLLNAAAGNGSVLAINLSPNGAYSAYRGTTDLGAVNTSINNPTNAVYAVGANSGWMFGDPQSSPSTSTLGTTTFTALSSGTAGGLVTAQPGSASWQMTGGACGNPGRIGYNNGGFGWYLSCQDSNYPSLATGVTIEAWFNYGYWYTNSNQAGAALQQPPTSLTLWEIATGSGPTAVLYLDTSGHLQLTTYSGGTGTTTAIYTGSDLRVQAWFHVAVTATQTAVTAYLNGGATQVTSATVSSMTAAFSYFLANTDFGTSGGGTPASAVHIGNCSIAHLAIYPRVLPAWRIWAHYLAANTGFGQVPAPSGFSLALNAGKPWPDGTFYTGTSFYPNPNAIVGVAVADLGSWNSGPTPESAVVFAQGSNTNIWAAWTSTAPSTSVYTSQGAGAEQLASTVAIQDGTGYIDVYGSGATVPSASSVGDTVQQRIERILGWGGVTSPYRCIDPSALLTQAALGVAGTQTGSSVQDVASSDGGFLCVDNLGNLTYWQRTHLASQFTAPVWNLGPTTGAGRFPYGRDIRWVTDPQRVWNAISIVPYSPTGASLPLITPANSSLARASQMQYGPQPQQITSVLQSQTEMQNQANWLLTYFGVAQRRAEQVRIKASSYPAAWPMVLGCNVGDVVQIEDWQIGGGGNVYTYRITEIRRVIRWGDREDGMPEASVLLTADFEPPSYWS